MWLQLLVVLTKLMNFGLLEGCLVYGLDAKTYEFQLEFGVLQLWLYSVSPLSLVCMRVIRQRHWIS